LIAVALVAVGLAGCTPKAKPATMTAVKGSVNLDGKPMPDGEITFFLPGQVPTAIPIQNGAYSGQAAVGKNRVEIRAYRAGTAVKMGDQTFGGDKENYLPAKYNSASTFNAEVASGGANDFKFDVTSN
jgi:hypothetical protein